MTICRNYAENRSMVQETERNTQILTFTFQQDVQYHYGIVDGNRELGNMKRVCVGTRSVFKIRIPFPAKADL
ncbi:hypothetical protein ANTQUA_LOCUS7516 [Anthophora quadrimaculata]